MRRFSAEPEGEHMCTSGLLSAGGGGVAGAVAAGAAGCAKLGGRGRRPSCPARRIQARGGPNVLGPRFHLSTFVILQARTYSRQRAVTSVCDISREKTFTRVYRALARGPGPADGFTAWASCIHTHVPARRTRAVTGVYEKRGAWNEGAGSQYLSGLAGWSSRSSRAPPRRGSARAARREAAPGEA